MEEKPNLFLYITIFFLGVAISIPLQIAFLYEHNLFSMQDWYSIFIKITPLNYAVMLICTLNAYFAFSVSSYLKFTLPIGVAITACNNFFVALWGTDYNYIQASTATVGFIFFSYIYTFSSAYRVLKNPSLQWWKIPTRYKQNLPVWIESSGQRKVLTTTYDISKTGTFLSTMNQYTTSLMNDLHIGEHINLYIGTDKGDLKFQGKVVRKEFQSKGDYPEGLGIQFSNLNMLHSFHLKGLLSNCGVS